MLVYRDSFSELWIRLSSNESLGILDSSYLEDYAGVQGYVTLRRVWDNHRSRVLMVPQPQVTIDVPDDVFVGHVDLSVYGDGDYVVEGRCRDVIGNYTIIGDVSSPRGDEQRIELTFQLRSRVSGGRLFRVAGVRVFVSPPRPDPPAAPAVGLGRRTIAIIQRPYTGPPAPPPPKPPIRGAVRIR